MVPSPYLLGTYLLRSFTEQWAAGLLAHTVGRCHLGFTPAVAYSLHKMLPTISSVASLFFSYQLVSCPLLSELGILMLSG